MINIPTVLILGAGASTHLGYPTGKKLRDDVIGDLTNEAEVFIRCGYPRPTLNLFRDTLFRSGKISVDAFLENRNEYIDLGKLAIARALIRHENISSLHRKSGWYEYLFNQLGSKFEEFSNNKLSILTFNYDRSLEGYLLDCLTHSYAKDKNETLTALNSIPIIHLHGQIGHLPFQSNNNENREYNDSYTNEELFYSANMIKIIHEDISNDHEFKLAKELIDAADRIYFLGFGYNSTNIERLNIPWGSEKIISGTCYGYTDNERSQLIKKYGKDFKLSNPHHDVLAAIRENPNLALD